MNIWKDPNSEELSNQNAFLKRMPFSIDHVINPRLVHGNGILVVEDPAFVPLGVECDGVVSPFPRVAILMRNADCATILAEDSQKRIVGAAHSGGKGTALNIMERFLYGMLLAGAASSVMRIAIGPGIGFCHYEVGGELAKEFKERYPQHTKESKKDKDRCFVNLPAIMRTQALAYGIRPNHIEVSEDCTYCNPQLYFSYRRDRTDERQLTWIAFTDQ